MNLIFDRILNQYKNQLPFVCFRKPNEKMAKGLFCKNNSLTYTQNFQEKGFVFAPFNNQNPSIIFLEDSAEIIEHEVVDFKIKHSEDTFQTFSLEKEKYISLVKKGVKAISDGNFKKVVLSRKEINQVSGFKIVETFQRLLEKHQNAFVYVLFHPKVGLWMGATPERLMTLDRGEFATMALASTQTFRGDLNPDWGEKEKKEHQYVINYIISQIQDWSKEVILKDFNVSETYTIRAGNLLHLKADISGKIGKFDLTNLLSILHPTPAVCGLPKEIAKKFILENEGYDRYYYTGFLGEINIDFKTELFVNLRCLRYKNGYLNIYAGGGITEESDPEKEWLETVAKTQTIKSAL